MKKLHSALLATLCSALLLGGCSSPSDGPRVGSGRDIAGHSGPAAKGTALAALRKLPVKGRAPMTGYDRDEFGSAWDDSVGNFSWSRNGCDTRNDLLARDLVEVRYSDGHCDVASGILPHDPYSGEDGYRFDLEDGEYATDLDAEHVVALGNAWATGAQQLSPEKRAELANDPINLMAVNPSLNRQKGDADAATWLPPNKTFRCSYVARQIRVKTVYGLWVTAPEKAAMEEVLSSCPDELLNQPDPQAYPGKSTPAPTPTPSTSSPQPKPTSAPPPQLSHGPGKLDRRYPTCTALFEAGLFGNYVRGQDPEYKWYEDSDGDGVVCES